MSEQMMILVAGPYRSGTNDDPNLIKKNVNDMTAAAVKVFELGHLPVMGEWFALPLIEFEGSKKIGDDIFNKYFHPISVRLIDHCDAVLRIGGASSGADLMVNEAVKKGKIVFYNIKDIKNPIK